MSTPILIARIFSPTTAVFRFCVVAPPGFADSTEQMVVVLDNATILDAKLRMTRGMARQRQRHKARQGDLPASNLQQLRRTQLPDSIRRRGSPVMIWPVCSRRIRSPAAASVAL